MGCLEPVRLKVNGNLISSYQQPEEVESELDECHKGVFVLLLSHSSRKSFCHIKVHKLLSGSSFLLATLYRCGQSTLGCLSLEV